ncbi:amidase family protein [Desulfoluna sp.]|uniref:amidase family protein n=1 Tax=Desulfoluna sp. TaxID=2045199 RepID=UPI00263371D4|nr:amidase family protein [Desulfoluna sp.]
MNPYKLNTLSDPFVSKNTLEPYAQGELDGLSFALKDNIDVAHEKTGYGSPGWMDTHPKAVANAICLDQLLGAGGTCQGKTISDELANSSKQIECLSLRRTYSLFSHNGGYGPPSR